MNTRTRFVPTAPTVRSREPRTHGRRSTRPAVMPLVDVDEKPFCQFCSPDNCQCSARYAPTEAGTDYLCNVRTARDIEEEEGML